MGIRRTQVIGLNNQAERLLSYPDQVLYRESGIRTYPDGDQQPFDRQISGNPVSKEQCGTFQGMLGECYPLWEYHLPGGRIVRECLQATVWSSGPCLFLALKEYDTWIMETLWTEKEIDQA